MSQDDAADENRRPVSRRAFLVGGLATVAAVGGGAALYLGTQEDAQPTKRQDLPDAAPSTGSLPEPRVRWSLRDSVEDWVAGPTTPAVQPENVDGWLRASGNDRVQISSFVEGDNSTSDWTLNDRPNDDRLTVSARVISDQPRATLQVSMAWEDDGVKLADSYKFRVPTNLDIDVDTWWNCRGTAPKDVLTRVIGVRVEVVADGSLALQIRDVRQPPTTKPYGPEAAGVGRIFFAAKPSSPTAVTPSDPYAAKVLDKLDVLGRWSKDNYRAVHIGEWAWPKETASQEPGGSASQQQWAKLADQWMTKADSLAIPYTPWGESAYWAGAKAATGTNYGSYPDANYFCGSEDYDRVGDLPRVISAMKPSAQPLVDHMSAVKGIKPSINVIGGCFVFLRDGTQYSSTNIGKRGSDYFVENPKSIDYLHSVGWRVFRMPFRWDRVMRTPEDGQLDPDEWGYVREGIEHILSLPDTAVIVDEHSSAQFWISPNPSNRFVPATKHVVDGPDGRITTDDFVRFWGFISDDLAQHSDRLIYEITNEPKSPDANAFTVKRYTQAVVSALREKGDNTFCLIPSFPFDNIVSAIAERNQPFPWILDPAGSRRHAYTFHHYMDSEMSGRYTKTYDAERATAR